MSRAVEVRRTYLEMTSPADLRPARSSDPSLRLEQAAEGPPSFFRYLYREVGRRHHWTDRLPWTDREARERLERPEVSLWVLYTGGSPAGYFELEAHPDGSVEIAYFGLLPEFLGRGWGGHLLTRAVEHAWAAGARRVWLHTCSLDHPAALPNYEKRGFRRFKEETYFIIVNRP